MRADGLDCERGGACGVYNDAAAGTVHVVWGDGCCVMGTYALTGVTGFISPDWLAQAGATLEGEKEVAGVMSDVWLVPKGAAQYDNRYAAAADGSAAPVRFWEHKKPGDEGLKQWDFVRYDPIAPPGAALEPPRACDGAKRCRKIQATAAP